VVVDFEQCADVAQHPRLVIHQQDVACFGHYFFPLLGTAAAGLSGMINENLAPEPTSLSTQILPPIAPTSRRAMASPKPMPSVFASLPGRRKKSSKTSM